MTKTQMTETKTNARETRIGRTHRFAPTEIRGNSWNSWACFCLKHFFYLDFEFVSNFVLHEACFEFII